MSTHYPGWKATVDGQDRPIYPANVGFRAVYVEAGKHTTQFAFRPTSFRAGIICMVLALLACAGILAASIARSRSASMARRRV